MQSTIEFALKFKKYRFNSGSFKAGSREQFNNFLRHWYLKQAGREKFSLLKTETPPEGGV